jgi:hypothetical protein
MKLKSVTYNKIAVVSCYAACIGDFAVTFLIGFVHKDYNFLTQSESILGVDKSPVAMYMNTWGVLFSLLFLLLAYALYKTIFSKGFWQRVAVWLIAIYGLGEGAGSGLFPYNHVGNELTLSGKLHSLFSGIGVIAIIILPFVLLKIFPKQLYSKFNRFIRFVAFSGLSLVIAFLLAKQNILPLRGLWQRLFILDYYLLLMVMVSS